MSDQRSPYRVHFGGGLTVQNLRLHVPGLPPFEGHLIDISASGASTVVRGTGLPIRALSQIVDLEFYGGQFGSPVRTPCRVAYANEEGHYFRCGLEFVAPDALRQVLSPELWSVFNRRSEVRLQFGQDSPAHVHLEVAGADGIARGRLYDLSPGGICVLLDKHVASRLDPDKPATAYFTLPGEWRQLVFRVLPRNARPSGSGVLVGMEFGMRESTAYRKRRELVEEYLARFLVEASV